MKKTLSDHQITIRLFDDLEKVIKTLKGLKNLADRQRSERVNAALLELIKKERSPCFLLPAVLEFIKRVDEDNILHHYTFNSFELWLNQYSGLSFEENSHIRAKIAGKYVARSDYQNLFPIGMDKVYEGTHFVTAHKSPDLDTTIASFWGWMDAFAARVGDGLHVWNLPDGPPESQIEIEWIFKDLFGPGVISHLPKTRTMLNLTSNDLMTQQGLQKRTIEDSLAEVDHAVDRNAVVVVDDKGFFLGDWRVADVEGVRQVIISLSSCLRWFENALHLKLITLFAKDELHLKHIVTALEGLLAMQLKDSEPALDFSPKQKEQVTIFMTSVLKMKDGLNSDFDQLASVLSDLGEVNYGGVKGLVAKMKKRKLFNAKGELIAERPKIFLFLEGAIKSLHLGVVKIRARLEKLDIALKTKFEVFGHQQNTVSVRSDVEEIKNKVAHYSYLTVTYPDKTSSSPVGVIHAADLRKPMLGTVSLRDFCNRDEMGIPSYLDVISVIDHHKSALNTFSAPMAIISDAQSSNTLVAQKAFEINDGVHKKPYFIHPEREYVEYLHFLYGIIDDTDLLSKVSALDVQVVASLLNRLKSLATKKKTKIIKLDDLPRDKEFPKKAAKRILQNEDMYSLYSQVYRYREKEVEKNISHCFKGQEHNLFADTKEQNGCCRVGQTKMFAVNIPFFRKHEDKVRKVWLEKAQQVNKERSEFDLHIHMVSTIVDAEEVFKGTMGKYTHQDEMWVWVPDDEVAIEHLKRFLSTFQNSPGIVDNELEVEFLGTNAKELDAIFKESFLDIPQKKSKKGLNMAVLKYKAGTLNSRKAMVSPFLPKLSTT